MAKPVKVVLVSSTSHPLHKKFKKLSEEVAEKLGVELEVKMEDYAYLSEHGELDDLGMPWLPQLLVELDNGEVKPILTKMPISAKTLQPDLDEARRIIEGKLKELGLGE